MYITTIYKRLSNNQKNKILLFLNENFNTSNDTNIEQNKNITDNFDLEHNTIVILDIIDNEIVGCLCILPNKFLLKKIKYYNIPLNYYVLNNNGIGCFLYNLCVHINKRNNHIGYNLIQYTIQKMTEININYLHTHAENEISKYLFLKNNFNISNNFINLHNQHIYIMEKQIYNNL